MWASSINFLWANILISLLNAWVLYYVMHRLSIIFNLNTHKWLLLIIAVILWFTIISTVMYHWNSKIIDIIWTFSSWIFVLSFLFAIVLLCEQIIWIRYKINPRIIIWLVIIILWIWTYFSLKTKITTYEISTNKINKDTKILLISDIHVDHIYKDFHINKIRKMIESEKPDIVLIAWDLMNKANKWYIKYFNNIEPEKAKPVPYYNPQQYNPPIFAVMWNHDVMWDKNVIKEIGNNSDIRLLDNEAIINLNWTTTWCVASASYHFEKEMPELTCPWTIRIIWLRDKSLWWDKNIDNIMQDILTPKLPIKKDYTDYKYDGFTILMTHQPISLEKLKDYPIDLEVAGHIHHGQIFWLRKVVGIVNDYWYWRYVENWKTAIVTQWIWTRWLPFRLGTQSEMVIINLKKN